MMRLIGLSVQGQTVANAFTVLSGDDCLLNSQSLVYVLASHAHDSFTPYLDDTEKVIAQIARNNGKSLHALDSEVGAERVERDDQAKLHKIPDNVPVRELTRDFDIS
jgi:hypothetical protein